MRGDQVERFIPKLTNDLNSSYGSIRSEDRIQWGDTIDVKYDTYRKKITIISLFCILVNLFLFAYVGPFPWSKTETLEESETNNYFYGWDAIVIFVTCFLLILGFIKRTTSKSDELKSFVQRVTVMMFCQVINIVFLVCSVGWTELVSDSVLIRALCLIAETVLCSHCWKAYKFLKLHSPIFA